MKRLLLLRHAKAVAGSKTGDHGRSLNERGRADAPRMAIEMQHRGYIPDFVLCSTAKRTRETWDCAAPELDGKPDIAFVDELYLAPWKVIAGAVRGIRGTAHTVLVIAHNPGIEDCAKALARAPQSDAERKSSETVAEKYPTAGLAVLDFEIEAWSALRPGLGAFVDFIKPKELTGG